MDRSSSSLGSSPCTQSGLVNHRAPCLAHSRCSRNVGQCHYDYHGVNSNAKSPALGSLQSPFISSIFHKTVITVPT